MLIFQLVLELSVFSPQNAIVQTIDVHIISNLIINDVCASQRKTYVSVFYNFSNQQRKSTENLPNRWKITFALHFLSSSSCLGVI